MLREAAEEGRNLIVVADDAYFGLFYGDDVAQESLFARLAGCHGGCWRSRSTGRRKRISSGVSAWAC